MRRRTFLKSLAALSGVAATGLRLPLVNAADHRGRFFVFVQADGGWDPTSFCDPKVNQAGEDVINRWADGLGEGDVPDAGGIRYADFANNKDFFENHNDKMLVINGVDAQTNSHTTGVVYNWSGRISEGYPTTGALLAARYGAGLPAPYLSFGGFSVTAGTTRFTRLDNPEFLRNVVGVDRSFLRESDWADLVKYRSTTTARLATAPNLLPADARNRLLYESALDAEHLKEFVSAIPSREKLEPRQYAVVEESGHGFHSDLRRQAQLAVLAFKTGAAVSADLWIGGFDTHTFHDPDHAWLLGNLTDSVTWLWDYAEEQGVDDDLVVVMGSDFGRTNKYNAQKGKDHWPIGSFVIMQKGQEWTNRVVGETDERHFAYKIDPATLERVDDGTYIYPKHIHKALRRYFGIDDTGWAQQFPFDASVEDLRFFG